MAKSENSTDSGSPDTCFTKTSLESVNSGENWDIVPTTSEKDQFKPLCQHISKAVDISSIKKKLTTGDSSLKCTDCAVKEKTEGIEKESNGVSICMKCGVCCCSNHVTDHFETPRSDPHVLFTKFEDWSVRCLNCNTDIAVEASGKLREAVLLLKNQKNKPKFSNKPVRLDGENTMSYLRNSNASTSSAASNPNMGVSLKSSSNLMTPRGLQNLGNTCFFNSVLQCLARTPFLLDSLLEVKEPGEQVTLEVENNHSITVTLNNGWGPVTEVLASTIMQMTNRSGEAYSPMHLLDALRKKHNQFMGYNQHDAHELLRTLLDCVKTEDVKRYHTAILQYCGLKKATYENTEDQERKKALAKEINKKLTEIVNIRPDPVFKGITVSANQCTVCKHKSEIPESFLDLSLPVSFIRVQPFTISRKKNEFGDKYISKHQLKKAAKKSRKMAKMKKRNEGNFKIVTKREQFMNRVVEMKDVHESGCSSSEVISPIKNKANCVVSDNNSKILAEAMNEVNRTPSNGIDLDDGIESENSCNVPSLNLLADDANLRNSNSSSVIKVKSSDVSNGNVDDGLPVLEDGLEKAAAHNSSEGVSDDRIMNSSSLLQLMNSAVGSSSEDDEGNLDDDDEEEEVEDSEDSNESTEDNSFDDMFEIKPRELCATLQMPVEDEENSIRACLREYTKCELLTENNKVNCEKCTKDHQKKTGEKKPIYQVFTKQLLIKSPPPVLILHLKRFETRGAFSFRKVDTFITFPLILDIGSFCSSSCEKLLYPDQKNILYSLYGIVEHSGSLNAGHYVAYIKVRKMPDLSSHRSFFLPKAMSNMVPNFSEADQKRLITEQNNEEYQWYYISDSSVRPIAEEDVLRKQAYLLFYERIW